MKRVLLLFVTLVALGVVGPAGASSSQARVLAIKFPNLEINPVTQDYLTSELSHAASGGYDAAVILLDTPGGLSTSMQTIYEAESNAKLPVIVYVAPSAATAASAGVWVAEAADVLAMSPDSNIGSSTPIDSSGANISGSDLRRKVINNAVATLKGLALAHHRNTSWPAKAIRVASNLTAQQALKMHVIDFIAPSLPALLNKLEGYRTKDTARPFTLNLAGAQIDYVGPGFFTSFLNTIIDPNLISLLFLVGLIGIFFEIFHPGAVLPGVVGAVGMIMALYGFSVLTPSWGGIALIVLGVALFLIDLHAPTHGVLTVAGVISLGFGLALLFQNEPAGYQVNRWLVVGIGSVLGLFWAFALSKGMAARRLPVKTGVQGMIGKTAEVRGPALVFVDGALWNAKATDGSALVPGEHVQVAAVNGLVLTVTK